ncbi:MAG: penicillin-binding protein [Bryobacterales bacterium]|nr:penicillin-binding protein [Bryobacterales bacterium]
MKPKTVIGILVVLLALALTQAFAATTSKSTRKKTVSSSSKKSTAKSVKSRRTPVRTASSSRYRSGLVRSAAYSRSYVRGGPWREPTFADSTDGDWVDGEDQQVRKAAVDALGPYNGTVAVVDPYTGRVLTLVNQKLALKSGFQPCSTIKVVAALAALSEGIIERNTVMRWGRKKLDLTQALAKSDNPYFAVLGEKLGFDRVSYYARLFGLGERAGLNIEGEQPGILPGKVPDAGVGMMTSFGSGISLTPLELAAMLSAIANGGTLYYLQHPRSPEDVATFIPRVKRHLDIQPWIPEVRPGMSGAVEFGTARRAGLQYSEPILGKTGTCTDQRSPTHLGWFGSFNDAGRNKLVVVVLLTGGKPVNGPVASGIAGAVYRNLSSQDYFAQARPTSPSALVSTQACCSR